MNIKVKAGVSRESSNLEPLQIPGWVNSVKPQGIADGGIPQALYDDNAQGLECLIASWTEGRVRSGAVAVGDRVDLYINDNPTPVTGKTVVSGEEHQAIRLYLPHGLLIDGVNQLHYGVSYASGGTERSRDLSVLYHLQVAQAPDLLIPPAVLKYGVDGLCAAQGVEFEFFYANRRPYDQIEFRLGKTNLRFDVPDAPAAITKTLFTDKFKEAGDSVNTLAEFVVIDQLGNQSKPENRFDVHLNHVSLRAPTVEGASGNDFDPTLAEIRVLVPDGRLLPGDKVAVVWKGQPGMPGGDYTSAQQLVSDGLEIVVPNSVLAYSLGKPVVVTYVIERNGVPSTSPFLTLNILDLPTAALTPPKILEAGEDGVLDVSALGTADATIHALLWPLIAPGQQCWMSVEGTKPDGTPHNMLLWNGSPAMVNPTWISQGFWPQVLSNKYLNELGSGTVLRLKFKVSMDQSNDEATAVEFLDRTYTLAIESVLTENFDHYPTTVIEAGESINLPSMRIRLARGNGKVAIASVGSGVEHPGKIDGQVLNTNYDYSGQAQEVHIDLNSTYSKVSFWIAWQDEQVGVRFFAADDVLLLETATQHNHLPEEMSCSRSGIVKIVLNTRDMGNQGDWIAVDRFTFVV